jgi:hypothetical protein
MKLQKYTKFIISVVLISWLSCSLVFAWTNLSNMSSWDTLDETAINNIIAKINENGNKLKNISANWRIIPDGFSETNGVIHTSKMPATSHGNAARICATK